MAGSLRLINTYFPGRVLFFVLAIFMCSVLFGCGRKKTEQVEVQAQNTSTPTNNDTVATTSSPSLLALKEMVAADPVAASDLGLRYLRGDGVTQDSYKGIELLRIAAENGDRESQAVLGKLYMNGLEEMGSDLGEAEKWLQLASSAGDKQSSQLLKEVQEQKKAGVNELNGRFGYRWYYNTPYRLYWHHGAWLYR